MYSYKYIYKYPRTKRVNEVRLITIESSEKCHQMQRNTAKLYDDLQIHEKANKETFDRKQKSDLHLPIQLIPYAFALSLDMCVMCI